MKFGAYSFDPANEALTRNGAPIALGQRAARLLGLLLSRRGETITKEALMDAAWAGQAVEESNLTVQIAALRKVLGSTADGNEWIITVPRRGYRFVAASASASRDETARPTIAVLPFDNLSNDPDQEFFATGLAEDLITDLSKVDGLTVIARNSSFAMRERRADLRSVGRDLGVRFIVEGSVRRAANKIRINAQLIETEMQGHVWAERFDGDVADVFSLQDQVVGHIVAALSGALEVGPAPKERRPIDIAAYDAFQRGRSIFLRSPEGFREGVALFHQAAELDPRFAEPHAWLAMSHIQRGLHWGVDPQESIAAALAEAETAVRLDPDSADALAQLGYALAFTPRLVEAAAAFERALRINPSHADAMLLKAELMVIEGKPAEAVKLVRSATRLNPYPPSWYDWMSGFAYYADGRYEEVVAALSHAATERAPYSRLLAAALAQLGRIEEARAVGAVFIEVMPGFTISSWLEAQHLSRPEDARRFADGYRLAGLPE